jgi:hypothetical protein
VFLVGVADFTSLPGRVALRHGRRIFQRSGKSWQRRP